MAEVKKWVMDYRIPAARSPSQVVLEAPSLLLAVVELIKLVPGVEVLSVYRFDPPEEV